MSSTQDSTMTNTYKKLRELLEELREIPQDGDKMAVELAIKDLFLDSIHKSYCHGLDDSMAIYKSKNT